MKKNQNLVILIVFVVLVAVAMYMYLSSQPIFTAVAPITQKNNTPGKSTTPAKSSSQNAGTIAFKSIITQPGSHTCNYEQSSPSGKTDAVMYFANGKMRAEFRSAGGQTPTNIMVYNGGFLYVWSEGKSAGTKKAITSVLDLPFSIPNDLSQGYITNTGTSTVTWDCHPWSTVDSMLTPPSYVNFSL